MTGTLLTREIPSYRLCSVVQRFRSAGSTIAPVLAVMPLPRRCFGTGTPHAGAHNPCRPQRPKPEPSELPPSGHRMGPALLNSLFRTLAGSTPCRPRATFPPRAETPRRGFGYPEESRRAKVDDFQGLG